MPQIPMGNFGQSPGTVAQPGRVARISPAGAEQVVGQAVAEIGQTGAAIVNQQMAAETRLSQQAAERDAQTTALRVRIGRQNDLAAAADTLSQEVLTGAVGKDKAAEEWQTRSRKILDGATEGLDQRFAGVLQAELDGHAQQFSRGIDKAVTRRNQEDTRANIMTLGEEYQRTAMRDRPGAIKEYFAQLDAMGPAAGMGPDDIAKAKQSFREGTAYTQATTLVGAARDLGGVQKARQALAGDAFADLDPQRRAQIEATLDGRETTFLQRQELAAQRAQRQAEARLHQAEAAFKAGQSLIDAGIPLAPDEYDRLAATTAGTPFAGALKQLQERAKEVGGFAAQPIRAQQATLDQVNAQIAQTGATEALVKRRDALQKVLEGSRRDFTEDPLRAGLQRGVIADLQPVDLRSVDGAVKSLQGRMQAASVVQAWAGRPTSPLTSDEAQQLGTMLQALPVQQRASALATLGQTLGPQASAGLAAQIDKKDRPLALALQFGASKTTEGRYTSELILKGNQALKDKTVKVDTVAEDGWRGQIAKEVGDAYATSTQADAVKEAAFLVYAGLRSEGSGDVRQAVGLAAGGRIVEHNGKRIPLPAGVDHGAFEERVRNLKPSNFAGQAPDGQVRIGGQAVPLDEFVRVIPDAQLVHAGAGRYSVVQGGRLVTNTQGNPIIINARP